MARPIYEIAQEIRKDWGPKVNYAAEPYLEALLELDGINDRFYADSARSVVSYFLANASTYRGENARRLKAELKALLKGGGK